VLDETEDELAVLVLLGMSMRTHDSTVLRSVGKRSNSNVGSKSFDRTIIINALVLDQSTA